MIGKLIILFVVIAAPVLGSSVKGYVARDEAPTKGGRLQAQQPVEQQRLEQLPLAPAQPQLPPPQPVKSTKLEQITEQREEHLSAAQNAEQKLEELSQQRDDIATVQQKEEAPPTKGSAPLRYEARPQLSRDELPKGGQKIEQREEAPKTNKLNEQKLEDKIEQSQRDTYDVQQVEVRDEQRRLEEPQPQIPVAQYEEQAPISSGIKGTGQFTAPIGEAEPYSFNYQIEGSSRRESGDTRGVVRGQYTLQGPDGSGRIVDYIADHNGFRASVNTNEFGTEAKSPAAVALRSSQPSAEEITLRYEGKTREFFAPASHGIKAPPATPPKAENWNVKGSQLPLAPAPQLPIALPQLPLEEPTKGIKRAEESQAPLSSKGQRQTEELPHQAAELAPPTPSQEAQPIKNAELRSPKALAELRSSALPPRVSHGFESATAHRVYRPPTYAAPINSGRPVRPHGVARAPPVVLSPVSHHRVHHSPNPVQGYRRGGQYHHVVERPVVPPSPRASFYNNFDDDLTNLDGVADFS